jgi:hypothetical protein
MFERLRGFFGKPGMAGTPPSARQVPSDPGLHAVDFSHRYARELDYHAAQIMIELGIPPERIGDGDPLHGIRHAAFHPHLQEAGTVTPDGRIVLDSGVMNPERLAGEAGKVWAKSGLRSRMQAIIAHELAEHETGSHEAALRAAPATRLPIGEGARKILRAMAR